MEQNPSCDDNSHPDNQEILTFYGTRRFSINFTSDCHFHLFWASWIHSKSSQRFCWRSVLVWSSYLRSGLPGVLFTSGVPTKLYIWSSSPPCVLYARLCLPSWVIYVITLGSGYKLWRFSQWNFLHSPINSCFLEKHTEYSSNTVLRFLKKCYIVWSCSTQ